MISQLGLHQAIVGHNLGLVNRRFSLILTSPRSKEWYQRPLTSWTSSSTRIGQFMANCYNDQKKKSESERTSLELGLPRRISLVQFAMPPMGTISQCRSFYSSPIRGDAAAPGDDPSNPTFRQRLRAGARHGAARGQVMAKKGATTATAMIRQYGPVFLGTYATVYFTFLGTLFVGIDSGLLDPAYLLHLLQGTPTEGAETPKSTVHLVVEVLEHYSWTAKYAPIVEKNPHVANLAVAWIAIKFTEPIRLGLTLAMVPRLARYFGFVPKKIAEEEEEVDSTTVEPPVVEETTTTVSASTAKTSSETSEKSFRDSPGEVDSKTIQDEVADESKKAQKGSL